MLNNIFIVEDDPLIALDIKGILTTNGYNVVGHSDTGSVAIEQIQKTKPDIILMDINIKGEIDGIEVAARVNETGNVPIVFLSALSDEETLSRAKLTRPFGYIVKPFEEADILATLEMTKARIEEPKADEVNEESLPDFAEVKNKSEITVEQLSAVRIFSSLSEAEKISILEVSALKNYSAGDIILSTNSKDFGFIVLGGRVGVITTSLAGKDLISTLLAPGDSYGMLFILDELSEKLYAKAQTDSKILLVPKAHIVNLLKTSIEFNQSIVTELSTQLGKNISVSQALAFSKVEGRIINAIIALLPSFGRKVSESTSAGRLFITRKELADFTGTTPETAIRVTKALERAGMLDLTKPGIIKILNLEELKKKSYE